MPQRSACLRRLNLKPFQDVATLASDRSQWETIVEKLRGGEMPPKGIPRPAQADVDALIACVQGEFEKADRAVKPDPGRVVARRLNRNEYTNTIRDLLGVTFRADKDFPTDDSSYGFDNIGEALTVSPLLIEKYLSAAEKIASAAIGADPLPKPLTWEGRRSDRAIRRVKLNAAETTHRLDVGAEYIVKVVFTGNPPKTGAPGTFGLWVDGNLLASKPMIPAAAGHEPSEEVRVYVEAGDHVFRAGLVGENAPVHRRPRQERLLRTPTHRSLWYRTPFRSTGRMRRKWNGPAGRRFSYATRIPAPPASTEF